MSGSRPDIGDRVPRAEAVVAAALTAFETQDWLRLITLTDADSVATLKTKYLDMQRFLLGQLKLAEEMDPALAEFLTAREEWSDNRRPFGELAGITTLEQVEALDEGEFIVRWAQARNPEYLVDGVSPWHPGHHLERRAVVGSIAVLPDTVAVVVRATEGHALSTLAAHSMIAVLGDNAGGWALDATSAWLGLADFYA